jgi:uncharacterized membrane protein
MRTSDRELLAGLAAALAVAAATSANAQENVPKPTYKFEKCYGVARAGQNDCFSTSHQCGGTSDTDGDHDAWIYVPVGVCEKIVGGSTGPQKDG